MSLQDLLRKENSLISEVRGFVTPLLNAIPRSIPDYTDHGVNHSTNLERLMYDFLINANNPITKEELFVLRAAIWLHDVGCLICENQDEKKKHAALTIELIDSSPFSFLHSRIEKNLLASIKYVIRAHQSTYDLSQIPKIDPHPHVRLDLMCAIFRLLDGCDIAASRVNPALYAILTERNLLNKCSRPFWTGHLNIISLRFLEQNIFIYKETEEASHDYIKHLRDESEKINEIFSIHEGWERYEVVDRILKLNWEDDL